METLTPAEVAGVLGVSPNRVRQLLREHRLMAVPGSGNSRIPADFLQDGAVLKHLPGLLTVLQDGGFSDEEAFDWLFRDDDTLPGTPVQALRGRRVTGTATDALSPVMIEAARRAAPPTRRSVRPRPSA